MLLRLAKRADKCDRNQIMNHRTGLNTSRQRLPWPAICLPAFFLTIAVTTAAASDAFTAFSSGQVEIAITGRRVAAVRLLDQDGRRTERTLTVTNGRFALDGTRDRTPYYEVTFER